MTGNEVVSSGIENEFYPPEEVSRTRRHRIVWRLEELDRVVSNRLKDTGSRRKVDSHAFFKIGCLVSDLIDEINEATVLVEDID